MKKFIFLTTLLLSQFSFATPAWAHFALGYNLTYNRVYLGWNRMVVHPQAWLRSNAHNVRMPLASTYGKWKQHNMAVSNLALAKIQQYQHIQTQTIYYSQKMQNNQTKMPSSIQISPQNSY